MSYAPRKLNAVEKTIQQQKRTTQLLDHSKKAVTNLVPNQKTIYQLIIRKELDSINMVQNTFFRLYINLNRIKRFAMSTENVITFVHLK